MTEINYTHILLDAIYEHAKFSSKFIIRESLKAKEKHIDNEEFYSTLLNVINFFETKINEIYASNLNRYNLSINEDKLLQNINKTYYPKPEIEGIGIALFQYYNKYSGHIFIDELIEIKSIINELFFNKTINSAKNISGPTIAFFCQIINQSGIIKQGELSNEKYCEIVISEFKLIANPSSVRKYYNQNVDFIKSKKRIIEIENLILPKLSEKIRDKVKVFIINHTKIYT